MPVRGLVLLAALAGCAGPAPSSTGPPDTAVPARAWADAVEAGDTEAAVEAVEAVFEGAGIAFEARFGWDLKPFDQPLNSFSTLDRRVTLGRMPTAAQAPAYWRTYSQRLTDGSWDPDAFFADAAEAHRLAAFNQAYLAAHEAGHGLAYHYAVNPAWDGPSVHCQEALADRVAGAFLGEVIRQDPRVEPLRARYAELIEAIDARIPEARRVQLTDLDDCALVPVEGVTDGASFQRYVSAFVARQRLLLPDLPDLAATLDTHIRWRRARFVADTPDLASGPVTTVGPPLAGPATWRGAFGALIPFERSMMVVGESDASYRLERASTAYALRADGGVVVLESVAVAGPDPDATAPYDASDLVAETELTVDGAPVSLPGLGAAAMLGVQSAVALDGDDLLALAVVLDPANTDEDESGEIPSALRLLRLRRSGGSWRAEAGPAFPRTALTGEGGDGVEDVMIGPDGVSVESAGRLHSVDLGRLAPTGAGRAIDATRGDLLALDSEGREVSVRHDVIGLMAPYDGSMPREPGGGIVVRADGRGAVTLGGSGLFARHDHERAADAGFGTVLAARVVNGALLVLDSISDPLGGPRDARLRRLPLL